MRAERPFKPVQNAKLKLKQQPNLTATSSKRQTKDNGAREIADGKWRARYTKRKVSVTKLKYRLFIVL